MKSLITSKDLAFSYGKQKVIDTLNLDVPKNSIYGFLGPNGAGKSTTIKLLLGLLHPKEGEVKLFQKQLETNRNEILKATGNLIEAPSIYQNLTAKENLHYFDQIYKKGIKRIDEVLQLVGLWEYRDKKAKYFSTGMKQRLGIGMAVFHDPDLLILDEPVNGLDPKGVLEVRELLLRLQKEGKTIFLSSHLLSEIQKLCTHVGIIKKGKMIYQGDLKSLTSLTSKLVEIRTNDNQKAAKILQTNHFTVHEKNNELLDVKIENQDRYSELISLLVKKGVKFYDIERKNMTLEDVFINLTSN